MNDAALIEQFVAPYKDDIVGLVHAVAEIPWGEGRTVGDVLEAKCVGTCTGKHLVLEQSLKALNIQYKTVVCSFKWSEQGIDLPDHLAAILTEGEWEHGHNFVQLQHGDEWIDVDITWDSPLASYGFRTLPKDWNGTTSFVGIQPIAQRWDGADLAAKKHELIDALSPEIKERRQKFLDGFIAWIASLRTA